MESIIEVDRLKKKFGDITAVDGLSFAIFRNEVFGLLGPNGAGKTTTISMICGLLSPTEGSIRFTDKPGKDHKSLIGYCPQENIFYPKLTCLEQMVFIGQMYGLSKGKIKKRAEELLILLGLSDKKDSKAGSLSGGMKRRLNIGLALIHDPEILILDEPEAGLDPQSRILVRDFIRHFGTEKTVILTTHNMDEADRLVQRVAIIDFGRLLLLDTPGKLKKTVGEGDILEVITDSCNEMQIDLLAEKVATLASVVSKGANNIILKHKNIIQLLPAIRETFISNNITISEIKLRENTLEDVFIHLTGRNLRQ